MTRDIDLIKYSHLAQVFLVLGDNVEAVSDEINKLQDALTLIKIKSMHQSTLSLESVEKIISKLVKLYSK